MLLRNLPLNTEKNEGFCFSGTQEEEERKGSEMKGRNCRNLFIYLNMKLCLQFLDGLGNEFNLSGEMSVSHCGI